MNIEELRTICLSFPAVTEDIKWKQDLVFSIGGKMFFVASMELPLQFSFKVRDELFDEVSNQPGFVPAPYMARSKWVMVTEPGQLTKKQLEHFIADSYEMVKAKLTKKMKLELGV